jgi:hypothetical protein
MKGGRVKTGRTDREGRIRKKERRGRVKKERMKEEK